MAEPGQSAADSGRKSSLHALQGKAEQLVRRHARLPAAVWLRHKQRIWRILLLHSDPAKPDYSKPGRFGQQMAPEITHLWDPDKNRWELMELSLPEPYDPCSDVVVEIDLLEVADCPPAGGFAPLVRRAEREARAAAAALACPSTCPGDTVVEIVYREWDCEEGVASATVQARRICTAI
ncbi:MAG: hypothetical protein HYX51_03050 [Chloroflexi bacterium]|nr:hypothetical protein [Chloroflexota bacterium]